MLPIIDDQQADGARLESPPEIVMRGMAVPEEGLIAEARQVVQRTLDGSARRRRPTTG